MRPISKLLLLLLLLTVPLSAQEEPDSEAAFKEISHELVCQCGCNSVLHVCAMQGCHSATPMREEIREQLVAGVSKEAIVASFVERYGLKILSAPPASGFHLSAWIMPFAVLVGGAFVLRRVLKSWKKETARAQDVAAPPEISSEQRARIEEELKDIET